MPDDEEGFRIILSNQQPQSGDIFGDVENKIFLERLAGTQGPAKDRFLMLQPHEFSFSLWRWRVRSAVSVDKNDAARVRGERAVAAARRDAALVNQTFTLTITN